MGSELTHRRGGSDYSPPPDGSAAGVVASGGVGSADGVVGGGAVTGSGASVATTGGGSGSELVSARNVVVPAGRVVDSPGAAVGGTVKATSLRGALGATFQVGEGGMKTFGTVTLEPSRIGAASAADLIGGGAT